MLRMFLPLAFALIFAAWIILRLVKKDLKQHLSTLYVGLLFAVVWLLIYFYILKF